MTDAAEAAKFRYERALLRYMAATHPKMGFDPDAAFAAKAELDAAEKALNEIHATQG